jgi:nickel/cobalt exporter
MISPLFVSILTTGFAVAFLHGALPNHWLPFVLVGRRQGWTSGKTLVITAFAGLGHAVVTMLLGLLLVALGLAVGDQFGPVLTLVAGGLLIAFGLYYLVSHARGGGHLHLPFLGRLVPAAGIISDAQAAPVLSDRAAITGLLAMLAVSPCEAFVPVYLSGLPFGWAGFGLLSLVLAGAAVASMVGLTGLSLAGARWLGLKSTERYEGLVLGAALCLLGLLVLRLEH